MCVGWPYKSTHDNIQLSATAPLVQDFVKKYETPEEELMRQNIWSMNRKYVEEHNNNADMYGFTTAMNEYADLVSGCGGCIEHLDFANLF